MTLIIIIIIIITISLFMLTCGRVSKRNAASSDVRTHIL